jgi:hypothetical protein
VGITACFGNWVVEHWALGKEQWHSGRRTLMSSGGNFDIVFELSDATLVFMMVPDFQLSDHGCFWLFNLLACISIALCHATEIDLLGCRWRELAKETVENAFRKST